MTRSESVHLGKSQVGRLRHACAFFSSDDEAYGVLLPFIAEGFACGHKAIHIVTPEREARHLDRLSEIGIDPETSCAAGQLELRHTTDTYLTNGTFDQDRMLAMFEAIAARDKSEPFLVSRIVCDMDWSSDLPPVQDELIEFEARVNDVWRRNNDIVICVYDVTKLGGDMVIDIMRTHPMVLIGNQLQHNPFFVPPEDFLRERRGVRDRGLASS